MTAGVLGLVRDLVIGGLPVWILGLVCVDDCGCLVCDLLAGFTFGRVGEI